MASRSPRPEQYGFHLPMQNNVSGNPVTQITGQLTRFLFGAVRYTPREPAVVIALLNLKGGCGKSTIAINLACALRGGIAGGGKNRRPGSCAGDGERGRSRGHASRGGFDSQGALAAQQRSPEMPDRAIQNRSPHGCRTADRGTRAQLR